MIRGHFMRAPKQIIDEIRALLYIHYLQNHNLRFYGNGAGLQASLLKIIAVFDTTSHETIVYDRVNCAFFCLTEPDQDPSDGID